MTLLIMFSLLFESIFPSIAFAQSATTSAIQTAQTTNTPSIERNELGNLKTSILLNDALQSLTQSPQNNFDSNQKPHSKVRTLLKKTFRSTEKIPLVIENEDPSNVQIEIFNFSGEKVDVTIENEKIANTALMRIVPPAHFKPGRYQIKVTDSEGNVSTQDFTWGVLAINTHKSIYTPNETAKIFMGVLDEVGNMVCEASLNLEIKDPKGNIATHSTNDKSIKVNPACYGRTFTMEPDFETSYVVGEIGTYDMTLSATTKNGTYTITDSFQVQESVPFDVERITATRIFPPIHYPVEFKIKANQDFEGEISEVVPESFQVENAEGFQPFDNITVHSILPKEFAKSFTITQPFKGNYITSQGFGAEETDEAMAFKYKKYGLLGHDGIDFPIVTGTPVLAADEGVIAQAKENGDYGTTIVIQHSWGRSYYGHLSKIEAQFGTKVLKGQQIGLSGNTGLLTTGPHLHFGIKLTSNDPSNGYYGKVNPLPYFNSPQEVIAKLTTFEALRKNHAMGVQIITWKVDVKKGDEIKLGYKYLAPPQSPQFYTLGPLAFTSSGQEGFPDFVESRKWQIAVDATSTVFVTSGTSWTVPTNWSNVNTIETIGGGGGGCGHAPSNGNGGGGGGAYAKITNLTLTPSASISISVGAAGTFRGDGGDTWFNGATCAGASVCADGGLGAIAVSGVAGGTTANSVGTTLYAGGRGGDGHGNSDSQGGGGGAAGPNGAGGAGGHGDTVADLTTGVGGGGGGNGGRTTTGGYPGGNGVDSATVGADGGNDFNNTASSGGTGGSPGEAGATGGGGGGGSDAQDGGDGGNGIDWDATHGSGGGGGGAGDLGSGITGGKGGLYGGGGAGGDNSGGQGVGAQGIIVITYTINTAPNTPSQDSPANGATGVSLTPTFTMTATDPDGDKIGYKVTIYSESSCTSVVQTNNQAVSSTGWTGTNTTCTAAPTSCYTSGTQGSYLTQSALSGSTQYWWKSSAKDPDNTNAFTDSSTCNSFTTVGGPTIDQILRHGVWFSGGIDQPFTF